MRRGLLAAALLRAGHSAAAAETRGHDAHWAYRGRESAEHWAELDPAYGSCRGRLQSPVDLPTHPAPRAEPVEERGHGTLARLSDGGHAWQAPARGETLLHAPDGDYRLENVHFHEPSEHRIAGRSFPLEAHFVHRGPHGEIAVLAQLYRRGAPDRFLEHVARDSVTVAADALPGSPVPYASYWGSLTTPPCTEGVHWFVALTAKTASSSQIRRLAYPGGANARPVQPLNGRRVELAPGYCRH